jgi:hypothetical protein
MAVALIGGLVSKIAIHWSPECRFSQRYAFRFNTTNVAHRPKLKACMPELAAETIGQNEGKRLLHSLCRDAFHNRELSKCAAQRRCFQNMANFVTSRLCLEARAGIEPACKDLQSSA